MPSADRVDPGELLGRRLFGKKGWEPSKPLFDFTHFIDSRLEVDLSVDRLGTGSAEKKRLRFLTPLGDAEATARKPPTTFDGWAAVLVRDLSFPGWIVDVRPAPITANDAALANEFHSEISREGFRQKAQSYTFATMMADRFSRKGRYLPPAR